MRRDIVKALRLIGEREAALRSDGALIFQASGGQAKGAPVLTIAPADVARMVSEGLLVRRRDMVSRSPAGRAFLRRSLATAAESPYLEQHREVRACVIEDGPARVSVRQNARECPLAWLATRRGPTGEPMITPEQYEAGRRLHVDYTRSSQCGRITQSWDVTGVRGAGRRDLLAVSEAASDARARVERALAAVGPGLADVLVGVCCEELGLEVVEKRNHWPQRSAKVVLGLALDRLAVHYGIGAASCGPQRRASVRRAVAS